MNALILQLMVFLLVGLTFTNQSKIVFNWESQCTQDLLFQKHFVPQLQQISGDVKRILTYVKNQDAGATYEELSYFVDKFGPRLTGTPVLEQSIDFMLDKLRRDGHQNVHGENVSVPQWVRGEEYAYMVRPRVKKLSILGLGYSVGTDGKEIVAPIIVVHNFTELEDRAAEVAGKIVVYNYKYESYPLSVAYRSQGASRAAQYGAVAAFIRSVTPFSINSPHAGMQSYQEGVKKIPAVSITVEDAELFDRLASRGEKIVLRFYSENHLKAEKAQSRNTISELVGTHRPEKVVLVSGHLDSWDVGQGAMDDGAGAFISWRALSIIKLLNLRPKQTIRSVLWTGEELGLVGSSAYVNKHISEMKDFSLALESDLGTFTPIGLNFSGKNRTAQCVMGSIMSMLSSLNATQLMIDGEGSDTILFANHNVPIGSPMTKNERYFYFHHTEADTMTVESVDDLDRCLALWASVTYAVAALDEPLPR